MNYERYFEVSNAPDIETFKSLLTDFAEEMEFPLVNACLVVDRPGLHSAFITVGNTPDAYLEASGSVDDSLRDPVMSQLKRLSVPFAYTQATYVAAGAADLWEKQAQFGYRTGIAVALHLPNHKHFLLGVDRELPLPPNDTRLTRMLADLQLLAVHAQNAAVRLLYEEPEGRVRPSLTKREMQILKLSVDGRKSSSIAENIHLSEHTVNFHLRHIFEKLGVSSKHQAVLKAISLGIL